MLCDTRKRGDHGLPHDPFQLSWCLARSGGSPPWAPAARSTWHLIPRAEMTSGKPP